MPAGDATVLFISRSCDFYAAPGCTGSLLLTEIDFTASDGTGGVWLPVASQVFAPAGSASALCQLHPQSATKIRKGQTAKAR